MVERVKLEAPNQESPFVEKFYQFFESVYKKEIEGLVERYPEERSLKVDFNDLEKFDFKLADDLIEQPDFLMEAASLAIKKMEVPSLDIEEFAPHIRLHNLPEDKRVLLREIGSRHIGKLICVEGVIKQITDVLPKLKLATWKCNRCGNVYRVPQKESQIIQPAFCECRHRDFTLIAEDSDFVDYQKIQIQESLELLKGSEQPTSLDVFVADDLVNKAAPGDKIKIVGILRLYPAKANKLVFGRFIETVHLEETMQEFEEIEISKEEEEQIKELAKQPDIYEKLVNSIAPSIYGHEAVKEAIALQLFSGVKKVLPNDQQIRGNIHLLLVGDPGVAKSAILMATDSIAPKSIYVGGKTTSAVGLCVAPDSLILNNNGFREIGEFVEKRFDFNRAIEEAPGIFSDKASGSMPVLNSDLKLNREKSSKVWKIVAPKRMIEIRTQSGKSIDLTPNTRLLRLKNAKIEWIKSSELEVGDFVATSRVIPEGTNPLKTSIEVLEKNKNIRIKNNVSSMFKKITNSLLEKYGELQEIAKAFNISRDRIYLWRSKKCYHGMPLYLFLGFGRMAGYSEKALSKHVKEIFLWYGKNIKIPRFLNNEKTAYFSGLLMGDGSIYLTKNQARIRFYNSSNQLLERFDSLAKELFGIETEKIYEKGKVPGRRINSLAVFSLLKEFGLSENKRKNKISHFVSESSNRILASFLRGLYDTDGYVSKSEKASTHIGFSTISKELAKTLQLSLLKFGIQSKLRERKRKNKISIGKITVKSRFDQYYIEIRGKSNFLKFQRHIGFDLREKRNALKDIIARINKNDTNVDVVPEIKELLKEVRAEWEYSSGKRNPSREKLKRVLKNEKNEFLEKLSNSDIFWEEIVQKKAFSPKYSFVFDLTVENAHNFIANGFFVHNTATAVKDEFGEGGWTLKAGALVLASGGIAMCDELDKMDAEERVALHESMEQGTISVAKAGIVTRFKTDTSILAAANPKFSRFDPFQPFMEQLTLPPTLISRFDLFFMIRDVLDRTLDTEIASHILKTHQAGSKLFQAKKRGIKLKKEELKEIEEIVMPAIPKDLLKKYISYARQNVFPTLTKEAIQTISDFYVDLRERGREEGSFTATHRQLEGLVRLAEASARVRLSDKVEKQDAERAIKLLKTSLRDVVTDPETGRIDIDIITSGQTHSQVESMRKVLGIIKEKDKEMDMVPLKDVLDEAEALNIDKRKAEEIIRKLERKGEIYRPRHGFIRPTESK